MTNNIGNGSVAPEAADEINGLYYPRFKLVNSKEDSEEEVGTAEHPMPVSQTRVPCAAADVNAPAVNTAAVVTYTADATHKHIISGVAWSYSGGIPVGGRLTITDGGVTIFDTDITDSGCGSFEFPRPKIGAAVNSALVITLAAAGASVTGKLSIENHWIE